MDIWINAMGNATTAYDYRLCKINKQQIVTTMNIYVLVIYPINMKWFIETKLKAIIKIINFAWDYWFFNNKKAY